MFRATFALRTPATLLLPLLLAAGAWAQAPDAQAPMPTPVPDPSPVITAPGVDAASSPLDAAPSPPSAVDPAPNDPGASGSRRMGGWMNPTVGQAPFRVDFREAWFPDEPVAGQATKLGYAQQDLSLSLPFLQDCRNEWTGSMNVRAEVFHTDAVLPTTGDRFPQELWDVRFGTSYRHLFDNGWIAGGSLNVGSASDKPFATVNEMTAGATGFLRIPQGEHNAWLFSLNYSTNSQVLNNIPIPGVAYLYAPTDWFQATVGFPFADVNFRPTDDLTLQFSYALLTNIHAKAIYRVTPGMRVYTGFDWNEENYFRAERQDDRDRFFYYYKRVSAGMQMNLGRNADLDLSSGYDFDRYYFEGRQLSDSQRNRVDVGDGPFLAARLQFRY